MGAVASSEPSASPSARSGSDDEDGSPSPADPPASAAVGASDGADQRDRYRPPPPSAAAMTSTDPPLDDNHLHRGENSALPPLPTSPMLPLSLTLELSAPTMKSVGSDRGSQRVRGSHFYHDDDNNDSATSVCGPQRIDPKKKKVDETSSADTDSTDSVSSSSGSSLAAWYCSLEEHNPPRRRIRAQVLQWKHVLCRGLIVVTMAGMFLFVVWDVLSHRSSSSGGGGTSRSGGRDDGAEEGGESLLLQWRESLLLWMQPRPLAGLAALIGLLALSALVFLPPSLWILSSSYAYTHALGFWSGWGLTTVASFVGTSLGAMLAFVRSRYMTRELVRTFSERYTLVKALDKAFKTDGLRILFLLRLSPLIPYNALNYIGGVTGVKFYPDFAFSLFGMLPGVAFSTFLGSTGEALVEAIWDAGRRWQCIAVISAGIAAGLIGMVWTARRARKELAKILAEQALQPNAFATSPSLTACTVPSRDVYLLDDGASLGREMLEGWELARDLALPRPSPLPSLNNDGGDTFQRFPPRIGNSDPLPLDVRDFGDLLVTVDLVLNSDKDKVECELDPGENKIIDDKDLDVNADMEINDNDR